METAKLIVMLTHHDVTVNNAYALFHECASTKAEYWGMKEIGLPLAELKEIYGSMQRAGKKTVLEVASYTEKEALDGVKIAIACGCDILMGTCFYDSVNTICKENNIKYMPFVGKPVGRPSTLQGNIEDMIAEAKAYLQKGVYGLDLLGYRFVDNPEKLIETFVAQIDAPVCIAGSIQSYAQLDLIRKVSPWGFTVGGAFFENRFGKTFPQQIDAVCEYVEKQKAAL